MQDMQRHPSHDLVTMSDKSPPGICGLSCLKLMNADIYCRSQGDGVPQGAEKLIRSSYGHSAECSGYIRGLLRKPVRDQRLFTEAPMPGQGT